MQADGREDSAPLPPHSGDARLTWAEAHDRLRSFGLGRRLSSSDAEDLAQEVLLRMITILAREGLGGGDIPALRMWAVARNVLHEFRRRRLRQRHLERDLSKAAEVELAASASPIHGLDDLMSCLRERSPGLSFNPRERAYLQLLDRGLDTAEAAKHLGWREPAAWSVRQRILKKLKGLSGSES
ncbi:MAG: hypothetical protein AB7I19_07180 [Planctomycetota bacterium]